MLYENSRSDSTTGAHSRRDEEHEIWCNNSILVIDGNGEWAAQQTPRLGCLSIPYGDERAKERRPVRTRQMLPFCSGICCRGLCQNTREMVALSERASRGFVIVNKGTFGSGMIR